MGHNIDIRLKRVYDSVSSKDGMRILVDGIWPRGIKKENLHLDLWFKDAAPSNRLRKWFSHDADKWAEFKKLYFNELENKKEILDKFSALIRSERITLLYSARDRHFNQAVALKEFLEKKSTDNEI